MAGRYLSDVGEQKCDWKDCENESEESFMGVESAGDPEKKVDVHLCEEHIEEAGWR